MWRQMSLQSRLLTALSALVSITAAGAMISIGYTFMIDRLINGIFETDVSAMRAAQELENALVMQKGYVTYYFQDADDAWLVELDKHHTEFDTWVRRARQWAVTEKERNILNEIESLYIRYSASRDEVVDLYKRGLRDDGYRLHKNVRVQFFKIIDLCRQFNNAYADRISYAQEKIRDRAVLLNASAFAGLFTVLVLGLLLAYILIKQVMGPIRQLALATNMGKTGVPQENEVKALSEIFQTLIADVDQTKIKLEWSREHLEQAEKWALVGKLAAGVAHSVRNPLTSVKMRLFSMERSLALSHSQKEDFEVISEEIRHIDTIVGNFLEFSRPPKLKMQKISPSDAVDMAVQLLRHRLESYDVKVRIERARRLPEISADPDQLKEVFVNLIVNACDAIVDGGHIVIHEEPPGKNSAQKNIVIRVSDDGPGVPASISEKLFQPFFSTKEEGTGLGLSIATRIVEEHGGKLGLESHEGHGATFIITLPVTGV